MSLRARLALLYMAIMGGIVFLFGTAVYLTVSNSLITQVDDVLAETASTIVQTSRVDLEGIRLPDLELTADQFIQVWDREGELAVSSLNLTVRGFRQPLDAAGLRSTEVVFRDVNVGGAHLRVLTVPLVVAGTDRLVGWLQVGSSLSAIDTTRNVLLLVLLIGAILAVFVAGLAGWFSTYQALKPLDAVTQTALQITRADDLSRRIPYSGPDNDEVGQLINAFNQTLSRLENLFNSQRRFLADVGHELRTPLTVIKGNVDLMRRMKDLDEESMESIENEVDRLTRLVGDLLLLAQAESGKLPLDKRLVELDTVLLNVMQQMNILARDKLQLKLREIDQVLVCGDQDRIKQVLVNLVGNAIAYTPPGGEVSIGLSKVADRARITVSDTGPGIPPEDLPHIFERFYRAEKSRTRSRDGKGFGLGLSIAYWIVRNHGGQIEVASREPHGTTFCVWLPLAENECAPE